jgi:hypothetical protein
MPNLYFATSVCLGFGIGAAFVLLLQKKARIAGFFRKLAYLHG